MHPISMPPTSERPVRLVGIEEVGIGKLYVLYVHLGGSGCGDSESYTENSRGKLAGHPELHKSNRGKSHTAVKYPQSDKYIFAVKFTQVPPEQLL